MENRTLRVGSLIKYGNGKAMVIGCTFEEAANKMVKKYLVVPYPAGYTGKDSLHVMEAKNVEPFWEGYHGALAEAYTKYMDMLEIAANMTDAAGFQRGMENAQKELEKEAERNLAAGAGGKA